METLKGDWNYSGITNHVKTCHGQVDAGPVIGPRRKFKM